MKKIAVIGTGLSALSLAYHLPALDITFFEKSWRPGGRISTRKHNQYAFDHGDIFSDEVRSMSSNDIITFLGHNKLFGSTIP